MRTRTLFNVIEFCIDNVLKLIINNFTLLIIIFDLKKSNVINYSVFEHFQFIGSLAFVFKWRDIISLKKIKHFNYSYSFNIVNLSKFSFKYVYIYKWQHLIYFKMF